MDQMVLNVQVWVNGAYTGKSGYTPVTEDGITGGTTEAALITALQIELGIPSPNGAFGPATMSACPTLPKTGAPKNEVFILQGALYCKGYNPNGLDGGYGNGVITAVKKFQSDAGLTTQDGITTPMIFQAILTTDAYTLISGGDSKIRTIQQNLNRDYNSIIGLIPSNGVYSKSTNVALIKALQHEEGNTADGFWGANTMNLCPTIPGSKSTKNFILLLQYDLYCNGFDPNGFDGLFGAGLQTAITNFETFSCLTADGYAGPQTWASLLVSTGDPSRKGAACDCSTTITAEMAATLKSNGHTIIGRYLTGKYAMTSSELAIIFANGLRVFPIFEYGSTLSYFSETQGTKDAAAAIHATQSLGFNIGIIYFAVDFDALDSDVTTNIIPYFKAINNEFDQYNCSYKIGIYGPRNICSRVSAKGYSISSFVCDMSTGFSGNIGYKLPIDWAFDQISTINLGTGAGQIEIDNNISSGKDIGVSSVNPGNIHLWTPTSRLAMIVSSAGFLYDPSQDIIYSRMHPEQENLGYCKKYDDMAATTLMSTIIDCEPIYFYYDKKDWLIEFWKGQYGLETGAEIGVYYRDSPKDDPRDIVLGKFFDCVYCLSMSFVLKKDGVEIFRRGPENHWWLTGFKWGEFTYNPSNELSMTISITLKNSAMRDAFLQGLNDLGYTGSNVDGNTVTFTFGVPKSQQPQSRIDNFDTIQTDNNSLVADYNLIKNELGLNSNDPNLIEDSAIQELSTELQDKYNGIVNWFSSIVSALNTILNF